jgi:cell division control protein 45
MPLLQPPAPDLRPSTLTYVDGYNSIVSRVRRKGGSGSGGVMIFAGVDVVSRRRSLHLSILTIQDGLLASRILASLFQQDDIPYRLAPIGGYAELEAKRDDALASEEVRKTKRRYRGTADRLAPHPHSAVAGLAAESRRVL